ncbi:zinc finger, CCHC-type containing protein, partial [Tanacetum coccineum]
DENPIRTVGDYSKPSHEGYRNTIELPEGNNVVPLRSDTIRLVQNGCSFYGLRSEDLNQHLNYFLKLVDSLDLNGSISTWEDLTSRFLAQFFLSGRTTKLHKDILMFQQHKGESLCKAWTRFKDILQKAPHHGIDRCLLIQIFYDHVSFKCEIDRGGSGKLRNKNANESWEIIENLALYDHESWNDSKDFVKPVRLFLHLKGLQKRPTKDFLSFKTRLISY